MLLHLENICIIHDGEGVSETKRYCIVSSFPYDTYTTSPNTFCEV